MVRALRRFVAHAVPLTGVAFAGLGCSEDLIPSAVPISGSIAVTVTTVGQDLDSDGYTVLIDGQPVRAIPVNGTETIHNLGVGGHEVALGRVSDNCVVRARPPLSVTVTAGGTVAADFQLTCYAAYSTRLVSGQGQSAEVGTALAEPLVVGVTDSRGMPVQGVEVSWIVDESRGSLDGFAGDGAPVSTVVTGTDSNGLAQAFLVPTWFGHVTVRAFAQACEDEWGCLGWSEVTFSANAADPEASLSPASATYQQSEAGRSSEPMEVSVLDGEGRPIAHAEVGWVVSFGFGDLGVERSWTDADGLARSTVVPLWFGRVSVDARVAGVQNSLAIFTTDATDLDATLTVVSGDAQEGKAGEPLAEPLVVRVTDGRGDPVDLIRVDWSVEEGSGEILASGEPAGAGLYAVAFSPGEIGTSRLVARLPGLATYASFTIEASVLVITLVNSAGYAMFSGPGDVWCDEWDWVCTAYDRVPLGTPVEWVTEASTARIVSTSVPTGGVSFDSGSLDAGDRFQFVPNVVGSWEYKDAISGAPGVLTVY